MGLTRGAGPFLDEASHVEDFTTNFPLPVWDMKATQDVGHESDFYCPKLK